MSPKFPLFLILVLLAWSATGALAFLNDNDPKNFFDLVEQAPHVAVGEVKAIQGTENQQAYFLIRLDLDKDLSGSLKEKELTIFQERVFPTEGPDLSVGQKALVLLAPLPKYTSYQQAIGQGAHYRFFGGKNGYWDLGRFPELSNQAQAILAAKSGNRVPVGKRKALLLNLLKSNSAEVKTSGALGLAETELVAGSLSSEEEAQIYQSLASDPLSAAGQRALVLTLKKSRSLSQLQKIANQLSGVPKWSAVKALADLGQARSTKELLQDYRQGIGEDKTRALSQIVRRNDSESTGFLRQVLKSNEDYAMKREAIIEMGASGGARNEGILLEQIQSPTESEVLISAQALIALGKMNSPSAAQSAIKLLDSKNKVIRDAAILSIYLNQDPEAARYMQKNFIKDEHGHFYPRHQSDIPGAAPDPGGHGHSHDHGHSHGPGAGHSHSP